VGRALAIKHSFSGANTLEFLKTFEGATASFVRDEGHWSLWIPELAAIEAPLTPASQVYFPVILRRDDQAIALRFFYDCSTGKIRYYRSGIPDEILRLPELENSISELFRHSLPVEAVRQRSLGKNSRAAQAAEPPRKLSVDTSHAEPAELAAPAPRPSTVLVPKASVPTAMVPASVPVAPLPLPEPAPPHEVHRTVRVEIGPSFRSVLIAFLWTVTILALAALAAFTYLRATEDPGVLHHRLQIEEMRARNGQ
jgi:hypothetical protein